MNDIPFLETSAKTNINVDKSFMILVQAILSKVSMTSCFQFNNSQC